MTLKDRRKEKENIAFLYVLVCACFFACYCTHQHRGPRLLYLPIVPSSERLRARRNLWMFECEREREVIKNDKKDRIGAGGEKGVRQLEQLLPRIQIKGVTGGRI